MPQKILVGYDGSEVGRKAVDFAVTLLNAKDDELVIAHILEWSPYSFLTPQEIEERHKRRTEELQRAEDALLKPLVAELKSAGIAVSTALKYGHIVDTLCKIAEDQKATQVVIGRVGQSDLTSRLFGSVAGSLAQASPVPVTIVP